MLGFHPSHSFHIYFLFFFKILCSVKVTVRAPWLVLGYHPSHNYVTLCMHFLLFFQILWSVKVTVRHDGQHWGITPPTFM